MGKELASITVHGTKKLYNNGLEDVLVFQCAVFCDLGGGIIIIIIIIMNINVIGCVFYCLLK